MRPPAPDPQRRSALRTQPNPAPRQDYLVTLRRSVDCGMAETVVTVAYVPDRLILDPAAFACYLAAIGAAGWGSLEEMGAAILDDAGNELVPRWLSVSLHAATADGTRHQVRLEERQPRWDNPVLLSRLDQG